MANDRLINSSQGDSIITELRAMNTNLADIKSAMAGEVKVIAEKDVNFYDYDGSIVASYTAAEFADLTSLPDNPTHEGLTSQGWNWSLSDAKTYVASYGKLNVGQMYIASDGKTRLYIRLGEGRLKPYLGLTGNSSGTAVSIDWGDNSTEESVTLNASTVYTPHEYAAAGEYVIAITVTNGSISFSGNSTKYSNIFRKSATPDSNDGVYQNILTKLEIGSSVTSIGNYAFQTCGSLTSVTIPSNVTSIGSNAFDTCNSLTSVTIPSNVTSIGSNGFTSCRSLTSVTIPSSVTSIGYYAFRTCGSLTSVTIPSNVTSIGDYVFDTCNSLTSVTIPSNVTSIGNYAFQSCSSLTSVTIPSNVTSIGHYAFQTCGSLTSVTIPSSVTSIGYYTFQTCGSLTSVTIPSNVTSIGNGAFYSCYGLGFIKFNSSTPPTAGSSAFANISTDCIIYVPTGSLSAYTSADNYPSSSTYTYVEY